jgi:hypothetical protein
MKIKLGTLRRLIRESVISEVGLSPALFRAGNTAVKDPLESQNISQALGNLERHFSNSVMHALLLAHADKYDEGSREFDDATYEQLKQAAEGATETMMSQVGSAVKGAWARALKGKSES